MPAYNASRYVKAAALSILTQTYRDLELIAIDDGSTDGTAEILEGIACSDRRVRLIIRENRGLVASLNQGLGLAQGALIARMDADDIAYPNRIATQVDIFDQCPKLCLLGMGADYLYPGNYLVGSKTVDSSYAEVKIESMFHSMFVHPTVMLNNDTLSSENIRYSEGNPLNEDHELWSRIVADHMAVVIGKVGLAWRQQHGSVRTRHFRAQTIASFEVIQRAFERNGIAADISVLTEVTLRGGALTAEQAGSLKAALKSIWNHHLAFGSSAAFERGFSSFIWNLMETAISFNDPAQMANLIADAGFGAVIGRRHRLAASLSSWTDSAFAMNALAMLRATNRRMRCDKIGKAVALPDLVVRCL